MYIYNITFTLFLKICFYFRNLQALEMPANEPTARWEVPLNDGTHVIEFEHGTATGKRVIRVDGKILVHREWMFRLVGDEVIHLGKNKLVIRVDPIPGECIIPSILF